MRKSVKQICQEMFPVLLFVAVLPELLSFFIHLAGLGFTELAKGINPLLLMGEGDLGGKMVSILPSSKGFIAAVLIIGIIYWVFSALFGAGAALSIYRKIKYDTKIRIEDVFFFFNRHFLFNIFTFLVTGGLSIVGFVFLVLPVILANNFGAFFLALLISLVIGAVISYGFFTLPVVLAEAQDDSQRGLIRVLKDTWKTTKGSKGMIFGKSLLYGLVSGLIVLAVTIPINLATANQVMENPESFLTLVVMPFINALMTMVATFIMLIAQIDIYRELVDKNAFGQKEEENITEEDYLAMEEDLSMPRSSTDQERKDLEE